MEQKNKGADQFRGYREADLHLCFRMCKSLGFSRRGSNNTEEQSPLPEVNQMLQWQIKTQDITRKTLHKQWRIKPHLLMKQSHKHV